METTEEQHGFDLCFTSEVPDYLKCVVCHLVLRNPLQISTCGHKFCEPCFQKLKISSQDMNIPLNCPVDRDSIDLNTVFTDNGMNRVIGGLLVKCTNSETGCLWTGELRDLKVHGEKCKFKVCDQSCSQQSDELSVLVKELTHRICKCEDSLLEKDKDIAFLKFSLQEVKKDFGEKTMEVDSLKDHNKDIERELKVTREQNEDLKQIPVKMENLFLRNVILEQKVESLENQLLLSAKKVSERKEIDLPVCEVRDIIKSAGPESSNKLSTMNDKILKLEESVDESLRKKSEEINELFAELTITQEKLESKCNTLNNQVTTIENILFCVEWKLKKYKHHFDIGKDVHSPIFHTQLKGYYFQLEVGWSGKEKGNLGIYLVLHRAGGKHKALEPFNIPYSFSVVDKEGGVYTNGVTFEEMKIEEEGLTIPHGRDCTVGFGFGVSHFLTKSAIHNYLVDDVLTIRCRFTPT